MELINDARTILKSQGSKQWADHPPTLENIQTDTKSGITYVYEDEGKILGTIVLDLSG